jgi:hypothetical protein
MDYATSKLELLDSAKMMIDFLMDPIKSTTSDKLVHTKKIQERDKKIDDVIAGKKSLNAVERKLSKLEGIWKNGMNESLERTPDKMKLYSEWKNLNVKFYELKTILYGNSILASHEFETNRGIAGEINNTFYEFGGSFQAPTQTHMDFFYSSLETLNSVKKQLDQLESEINTLQVQLF